MSAARALPRRIETRRAELRCVTVSIRCSRAGLACRIRRQATAMGAVIEMRGHRGRRTEA